MQRNRLAIPILGVVAIVLIIFFVVAAIFSNQQKNGTVLIGGLDKCSPNINKKVSDNLALKLYGLVKSADDYNKVQTLPKYQATIRANTCNQTNTIRVTDSRGESRPVTTTSVVIDIPSAKQSWKITYDWITKSQPLNIDLGTITPECLDTHDLTYGDFKCQNVLNLIKYGTDKYDPIMQYMPYSGEGFDMTYNPDSKTVAVNLLIPTYEKGNDTLIQNSKAIIPYWFQKRELDQSKYTVTYQITYKDPGQ